MEELGEATTPQHSGYTECYVAFIDILGFKQLVKRSETEPTALNALVRVLHHMATLGPTEHHRKDITYITQVRAFSDSLVVFIPTAMHGLTRLLCKLRYIHDRALEMGCCIRGGVTIGEMYWDDAWCNPPAKGTQAPAKPADEASETVVFDRSVLTNAQITFGPAMVEAYELESKVAIYPRVILSAKLLAHIQAAEKWKPENSAQSIHKAAHAVFLCSSCPDNHARSIKDFIRTDSDGVPFVDFFHPDISRSDTERIVRSKLPGDGMCTNWIRDGMTHEQFMRNVGSVLETHLRDALPVSIRVKCLWLANYFNQSLGQSGVLPLPVDWKQAVVEHQDS